MVRERNVRFLVDRQILHAVQQLVQRDSELLAAVAFWGRGAGQQTGITERAHPTRVLCDLLSGSCNPAEIRLLQENGVKVKYRPGLHAKVWMNGNEVVVGSANASMNGLGHEKGGANIEAAVHLSGEEVAGNVRKWFDREWGLAKCVDDALLQTAGTLWDQTQNGGRAITKCRITAYEQDELTQVARARFDQIAPDYYPEIELNEIHERAEWNGNPAADQTSYEFGPCDVLPTPGTVYMDYSYYGNGQDLEFGGFWEVIHNASLHENGYTLCLLRKRNNRNFPAPRGCGGHRGIGHMVKCFPDYHSSQA